MTIIKDKFLFTLNAEKNTENTLKKLVIMETVIPHKSILTKSGLSGISNYYNKR